MHLTARAQLTTTAAAVASNLVATEEKREFCLFVDTDLNYESC